MKKTTLVIIGYVFFCSASVHGQTCSLNLTGGEGYAETLVTTIVDVTSDQSIHAFSFGISHDETVLSIESGNSIRRGLVLSILNDNLGPGFEHISIHTADGNGNPAGLTIGCVTDTVGPVDFDLIPPASSAVLYEIDYLIDALAPVGTVSLIDFTDNIGVPPVQTVMVLTIDPSAFGEEVVPTTTGASILVTQQIFIRADINQNGTLSLIDGVILLHRLFDPTDPGICSDADDIDNDGLLTLADPIALFTYLFAGGNPIPAPSGICGPDQGIDDNLDCETYNACE